MILVSYHKALITNKFRGRLTNASAAVPKRDSEPVLTAAYS
jgi:hypothetical protein